MCSRSRKLFSVRRAFSTTGGGEKLLEAEGYRVIEQRFPWRAYVVVGYPEEHREPLTVADNQGAPQPSSPQGHREYRRMGSWKVNHLSHEGGLAATRRAPDSERCRRPLGRGLGSRLELDYRVLWCYTDLSN
jgi:hypothetical protein